MAIGDVWGNRWLAAWAGSWGQASEAVDPPAPSQAEVTPGPIVNPRKRRAKSRPVQAIQPAQQPDPWRDVDWTMVANRVEASLQNDRRVRANAQKLMLLMAA